MIFIFEKVFFDHGCETLQVPTVTVDGKEAVKNIISHFKGNGNKRIACISGANHLNISKNRKEAYWEVKSVWTGISPGTFS